MTYFKLGKKLHNFSHLRIAYILYLYFLTQDEINFGIQTDIAHSDYDKKSLSVTDYCKMVAKCVDYKISIIKDYARNSTRKAQKIVSSHKLIAQLKITTLKPCYVCGRNLLPKEQIWECSCNFQFERVHSPGQDWI